MEMGKTNSPWPRFEILRDQVAVPEHRYTSLALSAVSSQLLKGVYLEERIELGSRGFLHVCVGSGNETCSEST